MKAKIFKEVKKMTDIPNVGPAMVRDLSSIGIKTPIDLKNKNGYKLYKKLCEVSGIRHDPCVLDTFLAVVDFAHGAPARPWFYYTKGRKEKYGI